MRKALLLHRRALLTLLGFGALSTLAAGYILLHERVPNPLQQRYTLRVELANADAVAPGFGQPVTVAGVDVGTITAVKVAGGRAIVTASIRRAELPHVGADTAAVLAPRTPLKDMELELAPGAGKPLPEGALIPLARSTAPIDSDDLSAALDADTRVYLSTLIQAAGAGLDHRGGDLRAALHALRPTVGQLDRIDTVLASRRRELASLVHNLGTLGTAVAHEDPALSRAVAAAGTTLATTAAAQESLGASLGDLPRTLAEVRVSLGHVQALAETAGPAANALVGVAQRLKPALTALRPTIGEATTLVRTRVRPLAVAGVPLLARLAPALRRLTAVTPSLTSVFGVLTYLGNELAYDPGAAHSYLFWVAWAVHNADSLLGQGDANGAFIRGYNITGCDTLETDPTLAPVIQALKPAIAAACPK